MAPSVIIWLLILINKGVINGRKGHSVSKRTDKVTAAVSLTVHVTVKLSGLKHDFSSRYNFSSSFWSTTPLDRWSNMLRRSHLQWEMNSTSDNSQTSDFTSLCSAQNLTKTNCSCLNRKVSLHRDFSFKLWRMWSKKILPEPVLQSCKDVFSGASFALCT